MSITFLILVVLLVFTNTALGLFVAIELGYGPPTFQAAIRQLGLDRPVRLVLEMLGPVYYFFARFFRKRDLSEEIVETAPEQEEEASIQSLDVEEMLKSVSEANVSDLLDDESEEIEMVVPLKELFDDDLVSALMDKGTESWLMGEKHVETSILKLNVVMMKSGVFSANLDARLRENCDSATPEQVKKFMQELRDDCTNYLTSQAEITAQIQKRVDEFGELSHLADDIDYANMEQAAQIETTINNIDAMNPEETEETLQKLIKELSKLRVARHRLRDQQEKAFLTVVRYENRLGTISPQLYIDETVGVRGRIGLEATLADWWKQKRQQSRQICLGLIDIVHFSETNDEHGIKICDKVLKHLGRSLEKMFTTQDLTGVFCGNCFFVVSTSQGLRKTVSDVEKFRQTVARMHFHYKDKDKSKDSDKQFTLGTTAVVVEAVPVKTDHDLLQSAEKMLIMSKKKGRNSLFMVDQSALTAEPELVESPSLAIEHVIVDLDNIR